MEQIHGHAVMQMMLSANKTYTRATLLDDINTTFGANARFCTCSAENLTAEGLIEFLQSKGKFVPQAEGFRTSPDLMCKQQ